MIKPIRHFFVNWINGMKIHQGHFSQLQRAVKEYDRDTQASFITAYNYGLLDAAVNGSEALEYNLFVERPSKVNISLFQLRAVTASGERIELVDDSNQGISSYSELFDLSAKDVGENASYYLSVSSNQELKEAFGIPDPDENPPRLPNVRSEYSLNLLGENQLGKDGNLLQNGMIIARIRLKSGELEHDTSYIPPCRTNHCHPALRDFLRILIQHEKDIDKSAFNIIYKLNLKEQNSDLALGIGHFSKSVVAFIEKEMDELELKTIHSTPLELILHAKRFARSVFNSIELIAGSGKDEMLNYFEEISRKPVGEYLNMIQAVLEIQYHHLDISRNLHSISAFFKYHKNLFNILSTLDYIGKKRDEDNFGYVKFDGGREPSAPPKPSNPSQQQAPKQADPTPPSESTSTDDWW